MFKYYTYVGGDADDFIREIRVGDPEMVVARFTYDKIMFGTYLSVVELTTMSISFEGDVHLVRAS